MLLEMFHATRDVATDDWIPRLARYTGPGCWVPHTQSQVRGVLALMTIYLATTRLLYLYVRSMDTLRTLTRESKVTVWALCSPTRGVRGSDRRAD